MRWQIATKQDETIHRELFLFFLGIVFQQSNGGWSWAHCKKSWPSTISTLSIIERTKHPNSWSWRELSQSLAKFSWITHVIRVCSTAKLQANTVETITINSLLYRAYALRWLAGVFFSRYKENICMPTELNSRDNSMPLWRHVRMLYHMHVSIRACHVHMLYHMVTDEMLWDSFKNKLSITICIIMITNQKK